ncbi:hypothetical protein SDC9_200398 [bioreactor metagenome]|uniref:Uncharacterized protein n=1 Tax=bioreactor metagenome TaxID=1076179 RepID=A0A645INW0_9ZZZZ
MDSGTFLRRQAPFLVQNIVRHGDFSDIVEQGGQLQPVHPFGGNPHPAGDADGVGADTLRVAPGIVILRVDGGGQRPNDIDMLVLAVQIELKGKAGQDQGEDKEHGQPRARVLQQKEADKIAHGNRTDNTGYQTQKHLENGRIHPAHPLSLEKCG